ncbi:glucose-6-phosphate dehydrogenase [Aerococcaceae bacterium DSM 111021]|nr:glucose-6-phosphate dehydrogenase [Aerococcaceae bacterium DSM 111021]
MEKHRLLITLFGATGDLAARKLYPAIYRLYKNNYISEHFALIGTARRPWTNEYLREVVLDSIKDEVDDKAHAEEFISHFYYQSHDVNDVDEYYHLQDLATELEEKYKTEGNRIFYISLSPSLFPIITQHIKNSGLATDNGYNRLIIEKPFGNDFQSANELQDQLQVSFEENEIYRIDHYLGKGFIKSLLNLRFSNIMFKSIWNKESIDHVQITLAEEVGVEDRGDYYENSGVSKDMIQNHALQMLSLVAMNEPKDDQPESIRQEKIHILKNLHQYETVDELNENVVRGQYGSSSANEYKAYRDEDKVDPESTTETYFAAKVSIDLPEWEGTPFFIRSGKRLNGKFTTIHVQFKSTREDILGNRLMIEINPDLVYRLYLNQETIGYTNDLNQIELSYSPSEEEISSMPADYERLILACIQGNLNNFNHWLEVAHDWKFVDNIQKLWKQAPTPDFPNYPAMSAGPKAADELIEKQGFSWFD